MSGHYYLPLETAQQLTPDRLQRCKNLGLIWTNIPPAAIDTRLKSDGKSSWLRGFAADNHIDTQLVENVCKRWRSAITAIQAQHFTAMTAWRMVSRFRWGDSPGNRPDTIPITSTAFPSFQAVPSKD